MANERTMAVAALNGGRMFASAGGFTDPVIKLWDVASGKEMAQLIGHRSYINAMATSSDGRLLASASGDQTIRIWDWKEGRAVRTLRGHSSQVFDVAFSPDGQTLASGSRDGTVKLWNISDSLHKREYDLLPNVSGDWTFSPDSEWIVALVNGTVRCWATADLHEDRRFERLGTNMTSIAFSESGTLLAVGSEFGEVVLIHPQTGAETQRFNAGTASVQVLGFSEEERSLVTRDGNGVVNVWDTRLGQELLTLEGQGSEFAHTQFSPDSRFLGSRGMKGLHLWRAPSWEEIATAERDADAESQKP